MIKISEVYDNIKLGLEGKLTPQEVEEFIDSQKLLISRDVYRKLSNEFSFEYEKGFSLYSSDKKIIDAATDVTDYNRLEKFSYSVDKEKYYRDIMEKFDCGFDLFGYFHTHPASRGNNKKCFGNSRSLILKGGQKLRRQNYFPSSGDIGAFISDPTHVGYTVIGSKTSDKSKMKIGAFVPIADFDYGEFGYSALKEVNGNWIADSKISRKELRDYSRVLTSNLIGWTFQQKGVPFASQHYFIEIPIEIV